MDPDTLETYYQAITVIEAREALVMLEVYSYPHLKPEDQESVLGKLRRMAFPRQRQTEYIDMAELAARLNQELGDGQ